MSRLTGFIKKATCTCKVKSLERCAHIAAILFYVVDYAKKHGPTVNVPSTSLPCSWNQGKKRKKNPKPGHEAKYDSAKRDPGKLYDWDPRPLKYRSANKELTNNFVLKLQEINKGQPYMWETLLRVQYDDFVLDDDEKLIVKAV